MNEFDFKETLYTIDRKGRRNWVYSALVSGKYTKRRTVVAYVLMLFYLLMPWITIHGKQGIWLNIPERNFTFFGTTFWATDTFMLVLFLGFMALCLFFFTAVFGRVWCGWACPETVFLEFLFRPIERLIEGSPAQRLKLDQQPWTKEKVFKKGIKHALCAVFAWIIASTALAYFIGAEPLLRMMSDYPHKNPGPFFLTLFFMSVMAFQFGWFREQFCTILCPYARFQSVLMDADSLLVGYDRTRGEPRGKRTRGEEPGARKGDCIDCGLCVRVCPTGIDIRNGTQLECVACTACVDACNSIMAQMGRPPGLIRYATENSLQGNSTQRVRPRVLVYAGILLLFVCLFSFWISHRQSSEFEILRLDKGRMFTLGDEDTVRNSFQVHISNKSDATLSYSFAAPALEGLKLICPLKEMTVEPGKILIVPLFIEFPQEILHHGTRRITLGLRSGPYAGEKPLNLIGPDE